MTRAALVLIVVAVIALVLVLMRRGWVSRARQQGQIVAPPPVPAALLSSGAGRNAGGYAGRYLGTTVEGDWLGRVVVHDLGVPSSASVSVFAEGLRIHRPQSASFFIPTPALQAVRLDNAACGKAYGPGGVVVVTWSLGTQTLDTAIRLDDVRTHSKLVADIQPMCAAKEGAVQ